MRPPLEKVGKFLEIYNPPTLNNEYTENLNRPIITKEIEPVNQKPPDKEKSRTRWFQW